ncbi:hypothetical protein SARC_10570 [Sphaeroforma arctica JP610]|uniref:Uncharacterized protein n=1 Tax=Sphaeroforma arctica JP610 TaxID=667725 RepID=A0A0L0FKF6_9EUKA|nr:hypothetical protein SARC_10570 [Sphaeroforma arctica JP610]KNC76956.1 hypothetical protein SARC_10570 [Sphaeroforma arctica JP610]|eukprot:XP_014150858.1 hypothetical protein SARC_10570 [Sphaeroforma arctica JP610]
MEAMEIIDDPPMSRTSSRKRAKDKFKRAVTKLSDRAERTESYSESDTVSTLSSLSSTLAATRVNSNSRRFHRRKLTSAFGAAGRFSMNGENQGHARPSFFNRGIGQGYAASEIDEPQVVTQRTLNVDPDIIAVREAIIALFQKQARPEQHMNINNSSSLTGNASSGLKVHPVEDEMRRASSGAKVLATTNALDNVAAMNERLTRLEGKYDLVCLVECLHQMFMRGMIVLRQQLKDTSGLEFILSFRSIWVWFYTHTLNDIAAMFCTSQNIISPYIRPMALSEFRDHILVNRHIRPQLEEQIKTGPDFIPGEVSQMLLILLSRTYLEPAESRAAVRELLRLLVENVDEGGVDELELAIHATNALELHSPGSDVSRQSSGLAGSGTSPAQRVNSGVADRDLNTGTLADGNPDAWVFTFSDRDEDRVPLETESCAESLVQGDGFSNVPEDVIMILQRDGPTAENKRKDLQDADLKLASLVLNGNMAVERTMSTPVQSPRKLTPAFPFPSTNSKSPPVIGAGYIKPSVFPQRQCSHKGTRDTATGLAIQRALSANIASSQIHSCEGGEGVTTSHLPSLKSVQGPIGPVNLRRGHIEPADAHRNFVDLDKMNRSRSNSVLEAGTRFLRLRKGSASSKSSSEKVKATREVSLEDPRNTREGSRFCSATTSAFQRSNTTKNNLSENDMLSYDRVDRNGRQAPRGSDSDVLCEAKNEDIVGDLMGNINGRRSIETLEKYRQPTLADVLGKKGKSEEGTEGQGAFRASFTSAVTQTDDPGHVGKAMLAEECVST